MYIPLHLHTTHSMGDSILEIDSMITKMNLMNIHSCAITNHGSISDIFQFHSKMRNNKLKPILGCEFYINSGDFTYHLIVIAKTLLGFQNLLFLHNYSQLEGFYTKPRINFEILKEHSEDLIVTTACVGGELPQIILNNELDEQGKSLAIAEFVKSYSDVFEEFFLEIQPGDFLEQRIVNNKLIEISQEYNIPLVVTNDVHYLNAEDYLAHNIHVAARRKTIKSNNQNGLLYPDTCYYLMEEADLRNRLSYIDKDILDGAIHNTEYIESIVEVYDINRKETCMPSFNGLSEEEAGSLIEEQCFSRLEKIKYNIEDITDYVDRLYYELSVISTLKFNGYFLVVQDYLKYANLNDIETNAGRGSICSSLVAFLMGIHHVDPIKYNLLFERFLSVHRTSPPDIDCDFAADRREEIFNYVIKKYGAEHCALVSTVATRKAKAAIKDVGRVYGYSQDEFDGVAKLIPTAYYTDDEDGGTEKKTDLLITEAMEVVPELKEYYKGHEAWFDTAIKLTNLPKTTSIHAAGTLISPLPLAEVIPLIRNAKSDMLATSLNLKDAENVGLIKFDFLSIATLTTVNKVKNKVGIKDIYEAIGNCDDSNVWDIIGSKKLAGLFQISSNTYKQRMWRLAPRSIEDLASCLALVRGPCIASKADEKYMRILEGKEEIELIHPVYDDITWRTNGILIYQEQLMELCNQMGFSLEEGYIIMKLAAKKEMKKLKEYELKFMKLAKEKQMDKNTATRIFKMIVDAGLYSFNESHRIVWHYIVIYS